MCVKCYKIIYWLFIINFLKSTQHAQDLRRNKMEFSVDYASTFGYLEKSHLKKKMTILMQKEC